MRSAPGAAVAPGHLCRAAARHAGTLGVAQAMWCIQVGTDVAARRQPAGRSRARAPRRPRRSARSLCRLRGRLWMPAALRRLPGAGPALGHRGACALCSHSEWGRGAAARALRLGLAVAVGETAGGGSPLRTQQRLIVAGARVRTCARRMQSGDVPAMLMLVVQHAPCMCSASPCALHERRTPTCMHTAHQRRLGTVTNACGA